MEDANLIIDTVLLAGKIMIENGADMARVDDTLQRIARNAGIQSPRIFETTTGIMMSIQGGENSQVESIDKRRIDLERISRVNDASRAFQAKKLTLQQMYDRLVILDKQLPTFRQLRLPQSLSKQGENQELTMGIAALGYTSYVILNRFFRTEFASEFIAAMVIGICGISAVKAHWGMNMGMIITGGIMPLVPGVLLTNAVRDLLAGHILSGASRMIEGLITACALGMGIALVLRFS